MAETALGIAALYMVIGALAYAVTLSGREVTYIAPLSVGTEVALGLLFLGVAATVFVSAAVALGVGGGVGVVAGVAAGAAVAFALTRPLLRRWRRDEARVTARRAARAERRHKR